MLVDSHCHLDCLDLVAYGKTLEQLLDDARAVGVQHFLTVATRLDTVSNVLTIAKQNSQVYAAVGIQPSEQVDSEPTVDEIMTLADDPLVVAVGETGLDYYYEYVSREVQQQRFCTQIRTAKAINKPLIIHTRAANSDLLQMLTAERANEVGGVIHCFTEDWSMAKQCLDLNFHLSFSGIVTFKNAEQLRTVAKQVPLDRLLIETDSPYLAPVPYRGKPNQPAYVYEVAKCLARLKGVGLQALAEATTNNSSRLFSV